MNRYNYEAVTESGSTVHGQIQAASTDLAAEKVADLGYIPVNVALAGSKDAVTQSEGLLDRLTTVADQDVILFTKQFRTMLKAGISILNLLQTLEQQTEHPRLKKIATSMEADIKGGASLYEAFAKHPRVFSNLYTSMVLAGETSGTLPEVLDRITYILEHEQKVKSDIKSALLYPVIVLCFLVFAFIVLLTFVIPQFVNVFLAAEIDLPLPTVVCMAMYNFFEKFYPFLLAGAAVAGIGLRIFLKTEYGALQKDVILLKIPILGPLFVKAAMSRFASIFAILQASGISMLEAIRLLAGSIGNRAIAQQFEYLRDQLEEGRGIAAPLRRAKYFPPMVVNMVAIGEESGELDSLLREVSSHYDYEVEYATKHLADALGPLLTIGLAVIVGFFALAIFLPMWDLAGMVK